MPSIVTSFRILILASTIAYQASQVASAVATPPRILQEPVLGMRYDAASTGFDLLQNDLLPKCKQFQGVENWKLGPMWIYASVRDDSRIYYIVGGYVENLHPAESEPRFELDTLGGIYAFEAGECFAVGPAREVFHARYFKDIPQPILQGLAYDLSTRYERAFGGASGLRRELRHHHIELEALPPELHEAFKKYFPL
ncbi:MAG: hypothetical protein V4582_04695 [Pseudomonadota bacterium]